MRNRRHVQSSGVKVKSEQTPKPSGGAHHCRHTAYRDGKPRPLYRGWLHGIVSVVLSALIFATMTTHFPVVLGSTRIEQLCFLGGKLVSYAASAYYHLIDFKSFQWMRWANMIDVAAIPFAEFGIIASCASASLMKPHLGPIAPSYFSTGLACEFMLFLVILTVNGIGVKQQFRTSIPGRADLRSATVLVYYICSEAIAYNMTVRPFVDPTASFWQPLQEPQTVQWHTLLWFATPFFYVSAFACGAAVDEFRMKECACLPHHFWFRHKWTLHEDFHLLLLIADLCTAASIALYFTLSLATESQ